MVTTVMQYLPWYGYHGNGVEHLLSYGCHSKERRHHLLHSRDALVGIDFHTRYQVMRHTYVCYESQSVSAHQWDVWLGQSCIECGLRVPSVW